MLEINEFTTDTAPIFATLILAYEQRQKSRFKTCLQNGEQVAVILPRGSRLKNGDMLKTESGALVQVIAAKEKVSTVYSDNTYLLMKACYHLGNRHTPLQIDQNFVRYQSDRVLDKMLIQLDLKVVTELAEFEPEGGAYSQH